MSNVKGYAAFIAEQQRQLKAAGLTKEEVELDEEILVEFVRVAMQHAKDAISKGMSHDDAKNHVYKKTMAHAMTRPEQGAGGMITRIKIDRALDKAEAHLAKHYGSD